MDTTISSLDTLGVRAHQPIGQIAVELPGSTAVFRRLKLDFCCGGQIALQQACDNKGLAVDSVLAELADHGEALDLKTRLLVEVLRRRRPELFA